MKFLAAAAASILLAVPASAATIEFNVNGGWWTSDARVYEGDGHSVTVTAGRYSNKGEPVRGKTMTMSWGGHAGGLGVCSPGTQSRSASSAGCWRDEHTVDGHGGNEMVYFDFGDHMMRIIGVTMAYWDRHDSMEMYAFDGDGYVAGHETVYGARGDGFVHTIGDHGLNTGYVFGIGAKDKKADFKIKAIHFEKVEVVPLPAAGWLMLGGLGGLAAMRRRKKS
ncbi:MAG: VPLPA-CTERM sorting domain-containing protein [Pseudomonadota bacterium]